MNSNLFGDSGSEGEDEVNALPVHSCDEEESFEESFEKNAPVEEDELDYSQFINESDFEDEDTFDECLRIFKEGVPEKKMLKQNEKKVSPNIEFLQLYFESQ